jgi:hypothetical protein
MNIKRFFVFLTLINCIICYGSYQQHMLDAEDSAAFIKEMNARSERLDVELQPIIDRNKEALR